MAEDMKIKFEAEGDRFKVEGPLTPFFKVEPKTNLLFLVCNVEQEIIAYGILEKARQAVQAWSEIKQLKQRESQATRNEIMKK